MNLLTVEQIEAKIKETGKPLTAESYQGIADSIIPPTGYLMDKIKLLLAQNHATKLVYDAANILDVANSHEFTEDWFDICVFRIAESQLCRAYCEAMQIDPPEYVRVPDRIQHFVRLNRIFDYVFGQGVSTFSDISDIVCPAGDYFFESDTCDFCIGYTKEDDLFYIQSRKLFRGNYETPDDCEYHDIGGGYDTFQKAVTELIEMECRRRIKDVFQEED